MGTVLGIQRRVGRKRTKKFNGRVQHQPGNHSAGKQDSRHFGSDDVAHAEIFRRDRGAKRCARQPRGLIIGLAGPHAHGVHHECVSAAQPQPPEHPPGKRAAAFAGHQHVRAGRSFGIAQVPMLFHDQLPPQRDHEQHAQPAAHQREEKNPPVFGIQGKSQEDQRGYRENHSGRHRFAGRSGGLHDVVFENRGPAKRPQDADR
jgi:hypothetical protein